MPTARTEWWDNASCQNGVVGLCQLPERSGGIMPTARTDGLRWHYPISGIASILPSVVYSAIYATLSNFTKFRVSNLQIISTIDAANTLHQRILPREAIPSHYSPPPPLREDSSRVLAWEFHG